MPAVNNNVPTEVYVQVGTIARLLHDALAQLGVMPSLRRSAEALPDARNRLGYVADKSGSAAERVLEAVELAKTEQGAIAGHARALAAQLTADPVKAVASGAVLNFVGEIDAATARIDRHLTDIMLAQDFHDLTGQVVARVVTLAIELETGLAQLLRQIAPQEAACGSAQDGKHEADDATRRAALGGPVIDPTGRTDVVSSQGEVDDLLASLGF
ncbi:MAG: protein phosphatase CheZ [Rhodoferax sp.]|nr:protein phosphatase CheZ [Rhodoferax sp.]MCL4737904.1 protein phosphatase CheZ [Burkholderiaceae bacterium]MCP5288593.1 protein phosphatase CheZ [Burkholderiaceae bacterium]